MISEKAIGKIGWSLPLATIILTTTIHLVTGNYRAFPFFISEADYPGLERIVFKVGFSVSGLVLIYLSWLYLLHVRLGLAGIGFTSLSS